MREYDVLAGDGRPEPHFPVPWAERSATSFPVTEAETAAVMTRAGLTPRTGHDVTAGAVSALARPRPASPSPELSLATVADRPAGYGVEVLQGAFTLWNQRTDGAVVITTDLTGLSAGRDGAPVLGGGIFVSGAGDVGGRLQASRVETGAVHSDGRIASGTPDRISGGVFTVYGADVALVRNRGPVVTYGPNDMVRDNWGTVDRWTADAALTSRGPSGIGFVNFDSSTSPSSTGS